MSIITALQSAEHGHATSGATYRADLDSILHQVDASPFPFVPQVLLEDPAHGVDYAAGKAVAFYYIDDVYQHRVFEYSDDPNVHICVELTLSALTVSGQWFIDELMSTFFGRTHLIDDSDEESTTFLIDPLTHHKPAASKLADQLALARTRRVASKRRRLI